MMTPGVEFMKRCKRWQMRVPRIMVNLPIWALRSLLSILLRWSLRFCFRTTMTMKLRVQMDFSRRRDIILPREFFLCEVGSGHVEETVLSHRGVNPSYVRVWCAYNHSNNLSLVLITEFCWKIRIVLLPNYWEKTSNGTHLCVKLHLSS
jgi:hypothetical protein